MRSDPHLSHHLWRDVEHGDQCSCMLLAKAIGAPADTVDYYYCRQVLQKHWRVRCNHGGCPAVVPITPGLPPLDWHDPVQAMLLANLPVH